MESGRSGKQGLRNQLTGKPKNLVAGAPFVGRVMQPVGIGPHLDLMRAREPELRQKSLHQSLIPGGRLRGVQKVVSAVALRGNDKQALPLRALCSYKIAVSVAEFNQRAVAEILLILNAGEILVRMQVGCRRYRIERRQSR